MTGELIIGGYDARQAFGLRVSAIGGLRSGPPVTQVSQPVPGRAGAIPLGEPVIGVRTVQVRAVLTRPTHQALLEALDALKAVLYRADVALRVADQPGRELIGRATLEAETIPLQLAARTHPVTLTLECLDPWWRDVVPVTLEGVGATPTPCPVGSAPVGPVLQLTQFSGTVVHVRLRDALGGEVTTLELAGLARDVPVEIDCEAQTVRQGSTNMLSAVLAGTFPVLAPVHADPVAQAWPTLAVSQGLMRVTYARRWA